MGTYYFGLFCLERAFQMIEDTVNESEIKACPEDCIFDWERFHRHLDIAMAHLISETHCLPSRTSVMELAKYTNAKQQLQKQTDADEETTFEYKGIKILAKRWVPENTIIAIGPKASEVLDEMQKEIIEKGLKPIDGIKI